MDNDLEQAMAEFQRCIAERDEDGAGRILDEQYALLLVHPIRTEVPRALWLSSLPDYVVHSYDVQERFLDIDGDCAVVLHRAHMTATVNGVDRSGLFVISDTWRMRDGRWRVWRRHSTPLSAGPMPG